MTEEKRVLEEGEARCIKGDGGTDGDGRQGGMLRGRRGGGARTGSITIRMGTECSQRIDEVVMQQEYSKNYSPEDTERPQLRKGGQKERKQKEKERKKNPLPAGVFLLQALL